jgi:hypothetical protein
MKTYINTKKLEKKRKENYERNKGSDIRRAVLETRYKK